MGTLFENTPDADVVGNPEIIITDSAFHIIEISTPLTHLLGYSRDTQLLGKNLLTDLIFHAEDRDIIRLFVARYGMLSWYPVALRHKNSDECPGVVQVVPQKKIQKLVGHIFYFKSTVHPDHDRQKPQPVPPHELPAASPRHPLRESTELSEIEEVLFVIDETTNPFLANLQDTDEQEAPDEKTSNPDIVLIIDDDPAIIDVNATVLNYVGFKTYSTKTLEQGLRLIHDLGKQIKAIILDYSLLEMIGEPNIDKITQLSPHSALILSSGYPGESFQALLKNSKAVWLQKPYSSEQLVEIVTQQIKRIKKDS